MVKIYKIRTLLNLHCSSHFIVQLITWKIFNLNNYSKGKVYLHEFFCYVILTNFVIEQVANYIRWIRLVLLDRVLCYVRWSAWYYTLFFLCYYFFVTTSLLLLLCFFVTMNCFIVPEWLYFEIQIFASVDTYDLTSFCIRWQVFFVVNMPNGIFGHTEFLTVFLIYPFGWEIW